MTEQSEKEEGWSKWGLSFLFFIVAFVIGIGWIHPYFTAPREEPLLPSDDIPQDINVFADGRVEVEDDEARFIASYAEDAKVKVFFEEIFSLKGMWSGSDAKLSLAANGGGTTYYGETHSESWGNLVIGSGSSGSHKRPWLEVTFPVESQYNHKWVSAVAEIDVCYPAKVPRSDRFIDEQEHRDRTFRFFVVSPEEYEALREHEEWEYYQKTKDDIDAWLIIFGACVALGGIMTFLSIRESRSQKREQKTQP